MPGNWTGPVFPGFLTSDAGVNAEGSDFSGRVAEGTPNHNEGRR